MDLLLENKVTKRQTVISGLTDLCTSALFYQFDIALPSIMDEGEYEYNLLDGNNIIATGVLQIGSFVPTKTTYNNPNSGYTVYGG